MDVLTQGQSAMRAGAATPVVPPREREREHEVDSAGHASAFTAMTPVRRRHVPALRFTFWVARRFGYGTKTLLRLRFLHAARFAFMRRGSVTWLLFESNFNRRWNSYIDAFSLVLRDGMKVVWGGDPTFPDPGDLGPFKDYISSHEYHAAHFWVAYPDASARTVIAALALRPAIRELHELAASGDDAAFARRWRELLCEHQERL